MSSNYSPDEFDNVPEGYRNSRTNHRRQGVHREEPRGTKKTILPWIIGAAVLALILGGGAIFANSQLSGNNNQASDSQGQNDSQNQNTESGNNGSSSEESTASSSSASAAESSSSTSSSKSPSGSSSSPSSSPSPSASSKKSGEVNHDAAIPVYNNTPTNGLAADVSGRLQANGFTAGEAANWQGDPVSTSVVYYQDASQEATAKAVGQAVGITNIQKLESVPGVTIVIGPGYS